MYNQHLLLSVLGQRGHHLAVKRDFKILQSGEVLRASSDHSWWSETHFGYSLQFWEAIKTFSKVISHNRDGATKILKQSWLVSNNLLSCKHTLKAHAYVPDIYAWQLCKKRHLFRWQQLFLAVAAKMWMLGPLFTNVVSLSQSSMLSESWLQTHNNDKNLVTAAHISVNDPLVKKAY